MTREQRRRARRKKQREIRERYKVEHPGWTKREGKLVYSHLMRNGGIIGPQSVPTVFTDADRGPDGLRWAKFTHRKGISP